MSVKDIIKNSHRVIQKNSPAILTGVAVAGLISTAIFAVRATPKALSIIDQELWDRMGNDMYGENGTELYERIRMLSTRDIIRLTWRCYIPAGITGLVGIGCIIGASQISQKRYAALAGVYGITEAAFKEYRDKVTETIGKGKELKVRDAISADRIQKNPPTTSEVIFTGKGDVLCHDSFSGRYFWSDIEQIRRVINEANHELLRDDFLTLNDLYYELRLSPIPKGSEMGWSLDDGLIDVSFSSQLTEAGKPCLVLDYVVTPKSWTRGDFSPR